MKPQISLVFVLAGVACGGAAIWLLFGYAWALLALGAVLVVAGLLLPWPEPKTTRPRRFDGAVP